MLLTSLILCAAPQVDLVLGPSNQKAPRGDVVEIELTASAATPTTEDFSAIDSLLTWDPARLEFLSVSSTSYPWFVAGFFPDPDGINDDLSDGEVLFTALASTASPASVPPDILVATFSFRVLSWGQVALSPSSGTYGKTRVLSTVPGIEITGDISTIARVRTKVAPASDPGPLITLGPVATAFPRAALGATRSRRPLPMPAHAIPIGFEGREAPRRLPEFQCLLSRGVTSGRLALLEHVRVGPRHSPGSLVRRIVILDRDGGRVLASRTLPRPSDAAGAPPRPLALAFDPSERYLAWTDGDGSRVVDAWTLADVVFLPGVAIAELPGQPIGPQRALGRWPSRP